MNNTDNSKHRPSKIEWLKQYLIGLCLSGSDGRYIITVDVHRNSVSRIRVTKTEVLTEC